MVWCIRSRVCAHFETRRRKSVPSRRVTETFVRTQKKTFRVFLSLGFRLALLHKQTKSIKKRRHFLYQKKRARAFYGTKKRSLSFYSRCRVSVTTTHIGGECINKNASITVELCQEEEEEK